MAVRKLSGNRKKPWKVELYEESRYVGSKTFATEQEANDYDDAWRLQKKYGLQLIADRRQAPTFREYVEGPWIEHYKLDGKVTPTWIKRLAELRWHAYPVLGDKRLCDVTVGDVKQFQARMRSHVKASGERLRSQTIKNARSALSKVFEFARSNEIIAVNPVQLLSKDDKRLPKDPPAMKVWTEDQVVQFLKHMATVNYPAYVVYQVFLGTGKRPSELRGLCREQFDDHNGKLTINRQYSQREKGIVGRCKSGSHRVIDLPPSLAKILWTYCGTWPPKEMLFPFVTNNFLWKYRQEWMQAAGVPVIRNHDFRHTVAVQVYRDGMRRGDADIVAKLSRLLGHKSLAQTWHYLEGLLDLQRANDAATSLTWGDLDDDFAVTAAGRQVMREHGKVEVTLSKALDNLGGAPAVPYPIPIGRPKKKLVESSPIPRTIHAHEAPSDKS